MKRLESWFDRQARRGAGAATLEDAIVAGRFAPYARYRLRFFLARYLVTSTVHVVKFALLYAIFTRRHFVVIVAVQAAAGLLHSFWWGALEVMRRRVRELYRTGRPHRVQAEISGWLSVSAGATLAVLAAALVWVATTAFAGRLSAADLYLFAIVVRLALSLTTRCYHSGVYAIRRIYRPLPAMIGADIAMVAGVVLLWRPLGLWSFGVAGVGAALLAAALVVGYTRRTYRFFGFDPRPSLSAVRRPQLRLAGDTRELILAGCSHAVMALDSLLVLVLFRAPGRRFDGDLLFVLFFLLAPTVRAGFEWAHLFYFDLKRLEIRLFANLLRGFERSLGRLAWLVGAGFWAVACVAATAIYGDGLGLLYLLLLPFFVSRSLLAAAQIERFAQGDYGRLLANGLLALGGFWGVALVSPDPRFTVLGIAAVTAAATILLRRRGRERAVVDPGEATPPCEWLERLLGERGPVAVSVARFAPPYAMPARSAADGDDDGDRERWPHRRVAERLAIRLGRSGAATMPAPRCVAWFERIEPGRDRRVTEPWMIRLGGGLVEGIAGTGTASSGREALLVAARRGILPELLDARNAGPADLERALREFERRFADGYAFVPGGTPPAGLTALPARERRGVLRSALVFARDLEPDRHPGRFEVSALCVGGEVRRLFLVPVSSARPARRAWISQVRRLSIGLTLGPLAHEVAAVTPDANQAAPRGGTARRRSGRAAARTAARQPVVDR